MTATFILLDEHRRRYALVAVQKAALGMQVKISKPTRTTEDNSHLHAVLTDISDQLPWPQDTGELHDVEWWKRVLTLTWLREMQEMPEVIADVQGETFGILISHTSDLTTDQCKTLILSCRAFGVANGVVFKEPEQPEPPPREEE